LDFLKQLLDLASHFMSSCLRQLIVSTEPHKAVNGAPLSKATSDFHYRIEPGLEGSSLGALSVLAPPQRGLH